MPKPKGVPRPFKLTRSNYYDPKRPHISNSMVGDYKVSPDYYKRKHIDKSIPPQDPSPSMKVGSLVDSFIDGSKSRFEIKKYKKDDPEGYARQQEIPDQYLVSESDYLKAFEMAVALKASPLFPNPLHSEYQVPFASELFQTPICGLVDILYQDPQTRKWTIYDVKTTAPSHIRDQHSWLRTCNDFGYLRQLAHYGRLVSQTKSIKFEDLTFRHIVVSMVEDHCPLVRGYEFSPQTLLPFLQEFDDILKKIANKEFQEPLQTFFLYA